MQVKLFAALATLTIILGAQAVATAQRTADGARALEGGWVRLDTTGSGSFGGLTSTFARAVLTPEGAARVKPQRDPDDVDPDNRPHKAGEPYIVTQGRCGVGGPGVIEPNSAAFFVIPTRDELLITREGPGARHIYMDGRDHPPLSRIVPSGAGHSTARWEDADLVVRFPLQDLDAVRRHLHVGGLIEVDGLAVDERDLAVHLPSQPEPSA